MALRLPSVQPTLSYDVEYRIASFDETEGWLLSIDDDVAGGTDWRDGTLTYDFRRGAQALAIENRLETLRGSPDAIVLLLDSDGGGQHLSIRLRDSGGQYFETTIAALDHRGVLRAERSLRDIGGPSWNVFGARTDRVARAPLAVTSIAMAVGPGRPTGWVRLQSLRVHARLQAADGLRLSLAALRPDKLTLGVENLLPVPSTLALGWSLVGLDGSILDRRGTRLRVPAASQLQQVALLATDLPPIVQLSA